MHQLCSAIVKKKVKIAFKLFVAACEAACPLFGLVVKSYDLCPEVGIYKRKILRKIKRKHAFDQEKSKKKRKKTRSRPRKKKENKILTKKTRS